MNGCGSEQEVGGDEEEVEETRRDIYYVIFYF
jgi:hypothetical protein